MGDIGEDDMRRRRGEDEEEERSERGVGGIAGGGGGGGKERIQVSVRLRPLNAKELERNEPSDWECINDTTIIFRSSLPERSVTPIAYNFGKGGHTAHTMVRHNLNIREIDGEWPHSSCDLFNPAPPSREIPVWISNSQALCSFFLGDLVFFILR